MDTLLARYTAQAVTDLRWLTAVPLYDEVPDDFRLMRFKFPGEHEDEDGEVESQDRVESAREAGAEIRDELFA